MAKIQYNRQKCIGCGGCSMIDNDHFVIADDGKADLVSGIKVLKGGSKNEIFELEIQDEEKALVEVAIDACPAECIKVLG